MREERPDYFQLDAFLSEGEKDLRGRVRKFVDEECIPLIATHFDQGIFSIQAAHCLGDVARVAS